jgi:transposase
MREPSTQDIGLGRRRSGQPLTKKGDGYLRKLLVVGATSVIRRARTSASASALWIKALLERRPARVVTVAMANRTARIAWAVLARGDVYRAPTMA